MISYRKAANLAERLETRNRSPQVRRLVARSHQRIAAMLRTFGQTNAAINECERALAEAEPLLGSKLITQDDLGLLKTVLLTLGQAKSIAGNVSEASRLWLRSASMRERLASAKGADPLQVELARTDKYVIRALMYSGNLEAAERTAIEGVRVRETVAGRRTGNAALRRDLAGPPRIGAVERISTCFEVMTRWLACLSDRALPNRVRDRSRFPHREPIGLHLRASADRTLLEKKEMIQPHTLVQKSTDCDRSPRTSRAAPRAAVFAERPSSPQRAAEQTPGDSEVESMRCCRKIALDRCPAQSVRRCNRRSKRRARRSSGLPRCVRLSVRTRPICNQTSDRVGDFRSAGRSR
jgi:hypothetical protein